MRDGVKLIVTTKHIFIASSSFLNEIQASSTLIKPAVYSGGDLQI